jgi:cation transport protein ChaC
MRSLARPIRQDRIRQYTDDKYGYGSLFWKPEFEFIESRIATVRGWHRAFCYRVKRFRGTPDKPGLMLALDRGGGCKGMVFKLPAHQVRKSLNALFRRELLIKPSIASMDDG